MANYKLEPVHYRFQIHPTMEGRETLTMIPLSGVITWLPSNREMAGRDEVVTGHFRGSQMQSERKARPLFSRVKRHLIHYYWLLNVFPR